MVATRFQSRFVAMANFLPSWAEDHFVVATSAAGVGRLVVLGVGESVGACVMEGYSSGSGNGSRPILINAPICRWACEGVWRLAKAAKVRNSAAGTPTEVAIWLASSRNLSRADLQRQIVSVHIAQVIKILGTEADGELSKICLRLDTVSKVRIPIGTWVSPN